MDDIVKLRKRLHIHHSFPLKDGYVKISTLGFGPYHELLLETFKQLGIEYTVSYRTSYSTMIQYQIDEGSFNLLVLSKKSNIVLAKSSYKGRIFTMIGKRPSTLNKWKVIL